MANSTLPEQLHEQLVQRQWQSAVASLQELGPSPAADFMSALPFEQQRAVFRQLPVDVAARLIAHFPYYLAYVLLHARPLARIAGHRQRHELRRSRPLFGRASRRGLAISHGRISGSSRRAGRRVPQLCLPVEEEPGPAAPRARGDHRGACGRKEFPSAGGPNHPGNCRYDLAARSRHASPRCSALRAPANPLYCECFPGSPSPPSARSYGTESRSRNARRMWPSFSRALRCFRG